MLVVMIIIVVAVVALLLFGVSRVRAAIPQLKGLALRGVKVG